jgi:hypothetical protein
MKSESTSLVWLWIVLAIVGFILIVGMCFFSFAIILIIIHFNIVGVFIAITVVKRRNNNNINNDNVIINVFVKLNSHLNNLFFI